MNNRERLFDMISEHQLERREVAELLKVKVDTVNHWLISHESASYEEMPDMAIELLELKLAARQNPDDE